MYVWRFAEILAQKAIPYFTVHADQGLSHRLGLFTLEDPQASALRIKSLGSLKLVTEVDFQVVAFNFVDAHYGVDMDGG